MGERKRMMWTKNSFKGIKRGNNDMHKTRPFQTKEKGENGEEKSRKCKEIDTNSQSLQMNEEEKTEED